MDTQAQNSTVDRNYLPAFIEARTAFQLTPTRATALAYGRLGIKAACYNDLSIGELERILAECKPIIVAAQHEPIEVAWEAATSEEYWYGLEVLPPAFMRGGDFLVGEPADHTLCEYTGNVCPTWAAFIEVSEGEFYRASRDLTRQEFIHSTRPGRGEANAA